MQEAASLLQFFAVLLIATAPEEFGVPECTNTMEAAGLEGPHRWDIILPNRRRWTEKKGLLPRLLLLEPRPVLQ